MTNTLFPQPNEDNDAANFGQWMHQNNGSEYVVSGMEFELTDSGSVVEISSGKARLMTDGYTATQSGIYRTGGIQFVADMDSHSISLPETTTAYIYIQPHLDGDQDATPTFEVEESNSPPGGNSLLIGEVDLPDESYTLHNRRPSAEYEDIRSREIVAEFKNKMPTFSNTNSASNEEGNVVYLDGNGSGDEGFYGRTSTGYERLRDAETFDGYDSDDFVLSDDDASVDSLSTDSIKFENIEFDGIGANNGRMGYDHSDGLKYHNNGWHQIYTEDFQQTDIDGNTIWHAGNDGKYSGLDADSVDGIHGKNIYRSDTGGRIDSNVIVTAGGQYHGNPSDGEVLRFGGNVSDSLIDVQGGHGRFAMTWNLTYQNGEWKHIVGDEGAAMVHMNGGYLELMVDEERDNNATAEFVTMGLSTSGLEIPQFDHQPSNAKDGTLVYRSDKE